MTYRLFSLILAGLLALPCADAGAEALEPEGKLQGKTRRGGRQNP